MTWLAGVIVSSSPKGLNSNTKAVQELGVLVVTCFISTLCPRSIRLTIWGFL